MDESASPVYGSVDIGQWKGNVLVDPDPAKAASHSNLWRTWLATLVTESQRLPDVRVLKTSDTVEVLEARCPLPQPQRVVCKQFKNHGLKDRLLGIFRPSSARRNFHRARAMQSAGIGTAMPLACLECRSPRGSWLVTEFLDGVLDLDSYVLSVLPRMAPVRNRAQRHGLIDAVAKTFRRLEQAGLYHRDMKASNLLIANRPDGSRPQVYIVDLEGLERRHPGRSRWKPIARLAASLLQYPTITRTDYARFLKAYLNAGQEDARAWRTHFPRLRKKAARYAQAARKRKSDKLDGFTG